MENDRFAEDGFALCSEFRESGLTQDEFCGSRGISRSKLTYWLRKERTAHPGQSFVRVTPSVGQSQTGVLRIRIDDRVTIELDHSIGKAELMKVLSAVTSL